MGYIFDFNDSVKYDKWFDNERNGIVLDLEIRLMLHMLRPVRGETVLDIGCGTGESVIPLLEKELQVTGIDPSPYMIDLARKKVNNRVDLHRGFAEDLPFEDNSFNYASFFTALEFVEDPQKAIEEACRVAKDKVFIGVLNKYAIKGIHRRISGMFAETIYNKARFYSIWELKNIIYRLLGDVPVYWRTVYQLPYLPDKIVLGIERFRLIQRSPFGTFVGIIITPVPRLMTKTLPLKYNTKPVASSSAGYSGAVRRQKQWKHFFMSS